MAHDHAKTLKRMEEELKLAGYSPRTAGREGSAVTTGFGTNISIPRISPVAGLRPTCAQRSPIGYNPGNEIAEALCSSRNDHREGTHLPPTPAQIRALRALPVDFEREPRRSNSTRATTVPLSHGFVQRWPI